MCRMVGIVSSQAGPVAYELTEAPHSLLWLSRNGFQPYTGQRGSHPDGWGLAWREGGEMKLVKGSLPAGEDGHFPEQARAITTDLLIAHVRKASDKKTVSTPNSHPFQHGKLLFAHNGDVDIPGEFPVDSQRLLAFLAGRWDGTIAGLVRAVGEARAFRHTSLSFLMTEGQALYALRLVNPQPRFLQYYTLYLKQAQGKTVIASEPLNEGGWEPVDNATLLVMRGGEEIERIKL